MTPTTTYRVQSAGITFHTTDARDAERRSREGARVTAVTTA